MITSENSAHQIEATQFGGYTDENAPALALHGLTKSYGSTKALDGVSFTLQRHGMIGLVGENGAGKSTLLSIVNGTVRPDSGSLEILGRPVRFGHPTDAAKNGIATVFQEQGLIPTLRVYENIFLGREQQFNVGGILLQNKMIAKTKSILEELELEIDPQANTGSLSFGQRQLVEIARAFALSWFYPVDPIILLDEPTSALSEKETEKLFDGIRRWRKRASFVLVSHHLSDVFDLCEEVVALKDGRVVDQRSTSDIDESGLHELIVGRQKNAEYYRENIQTVPSTTITLTTEGISKFPELENVSIDLHEGEILGVAGVLGSGKSTLASIIAGAEAQSSGEVRVDNVALQPGLRSDAIRFGIGYVTAERNAGGIIGSHSIEWNITLPNLAQIAWSLFGIISAKKSGKLARDWMSRLNVIAAGPTALCQTMSGGNQQKVVFAKWLARNARILVLDDPGRGLDVGAKEDVYSLMREFTANGGAILLVSDNLPEIIGLSNRILVLSKGKVSALIDAPKQSKPEEVEILAAML